MLQIVQQWVSDVTGALPDVPRPKFTVPTWPIDPLDPWRGTDTEGSDFWQMYVTRGMDDIEVVVEVCDCLCKTRVDCQSNHPYLGPCFDLKGQQVHLSNEEEADARNGWRSWQESQGPLE